MKFRSGRSVLLVLIAAVALVVSGVNVSSASAFSSKAKVSAKGKKGPRGKRGKRGPRGPQGPQGPKGDTGPAGAGFSGTVPVLAFKFLAIGNKENTTIANVTGATAESGCQGSTFDQPRFRGTADNGAVDVINVRAGTVAQDADLDTGQNVSLIPANMDDQFDLTYSSSNGTQVATAHYSAIDGAGVNGQFDCAIFGTISIAG